MEKKKQPEREGEREGEAREVLRPDPLVATSVLPGGPAQGAPAAETPLPVSALGGRLACAEENKD